MINTNIIGFVGKAPEEKSFGTRNVWEFSVAVSRPDRNGEKQQANWFTVKVDRGPRADKFIPNIKKGSQVFVAGTLQITPAKNAGQDPWLDLNAPIDFVRFTGAPSIERKQEATQEKKQEQTGTDAPMDF